MYRLSYRGSYTFMNDKTVCICLIVTQELVGIMMLTLKVYKLFDIIADKSYLFIK